MAEWISHLKRRLQSAPQPPDIAQQRSSRLFYALGESSWVAVDQLSANTYLAALMLYLGFSDSIIGALMSVSALVCVVQFLTISLSRRFHGKRMVVTVTSAQRLWMAFLFFIPFFPLSVELKMVLMVAVYFLFKTAISFGGPAASEWVAQMTPKRIIGRYLSAKDATAVGFQAVVLLVASVILDTYKTTQPLRAFGLLGIMVVVLCLFGFIAYMRVEDVEEETANIPKHKRERIWPQIVCCLKSPAFRTVMVMDCLWQISYYIASPYNASYSIKEMSLSFTFMSAVGFAGNFARILIARQMGKWADRTSMAKVLRWSLILFAIQYVIWILMRPEMATWMYLIMMAFSASGWSFIGVGLFGVKLELLPPGQRQVQFAVTAAISGLVGFIMSCIGGGLLDWLQKLDMSLNGMVIYPQQILNLLGVICVLLLCLYLKLVVERREKENE
ncbi:MAG: MFS transporter [Eubacteriales bacterium]|nr:MFS transporter [Eubacteriales bacterium]